jgi:hypothetical protein
MEIYSNVISFIEFSGIQKDYKGVDIKSTVDNSLPIDIDLEKYLIRIYYKNCKLRSGKQITSFISSSKKDLILIKDTNWTRFNSSDNLILMTFTDFECDIAPMYSYLICLKVITQEELGPLNIDKNSLSKIPTYDKLAKWMLLKAGDILYYEFVTLDQIMPRARICIEGDY